MLPGWNLAEKAQNILLIIIDMWRYSHFGAAQRDVDIVAFQLIHDTGRRMIAEIEYGDMRRTIPFVRDCQPALFCFLPDQLVEVM